MKKISLLLLSFLTIQVASQTIDTDQLKKAFLKLENDNSIINQERYFNLFPNSFTSFVNVFGYVNDKPAPLYDGHEYVLKFFELGGINEFSLMEKCFNISIGGEWEADAINYFQHGLHSLVLQNVGLNYQVLKDKSDSEIESFYYFFFHSIHPVFHVIPDEFKTLETTNESFYTLIEEGHIRALKNSGH